MIDAVTDGGLEAFHKMEDQEKLHCRQRAIDTIGKESAESGKVAIVAGHLMFWSEHENDNAYSDRHVRSVYTQRDLETYTHILYLDVDAATIAEQRLHDTRRRERASGGHLGRWQEEEKSKLCSLCRDHGILFSLISPDPTPLKNASKLLQDIQRHSEEFNLSQAKHKLDELISSRQDQLCTMLVIDADKTLAAEDTGVSFWDRVSKAPELTKTPELKGDAKILSNLFSSPLGYTYTAFRQAVLLYEQMVTEEQFEQLCQGVASAVSMYPEFICLLQLVAEQEHVGAVVVTSGLRRVWEKVLEKEGLGDRVKVIGGGRITDDIVVPAAVKGALVSHLQNVHDINVWAIGDSTLDLDMLRKAGRAIVVVGEEQARSKSMDEALKEAINYRGLRADQALLPSTVSPRLNIKKLPLISLTGSEFLGDLLCNRHTHGGTQVICATEKNAKLLATPMRDSAIAGPALRKAHRHVGWYLATEFLPDVIGLEPKPIQHVLGRPTMGYQLFHEQQTTIVALMRGGEPMASGVSNAFPLAMYVHAREAEDLKEHHLEGKVTVILVDSVVNTGKSIAEFVNHIRKLHATIRIVIVAGVVQAQCVTGGYLNPEISRQPKLHVVALRLSDTKFTGSGTTDTGNRLFNTTQLL